MKRQQRRKSETSLEDSIKEQLTQEGYSLTPTYEMFSVTREIHWFLHDNGDYICIRSSNEGVVITMRKAGKITERTYDKQTKEVQVKEFILV